VLQYICSREWSTSCRLKHYTSVLTVSKAETWFFKGHQLPKRRFLQLNWWFLLTTDGAGTPVSMLRHAFSTPSHVPVTLNTCSLCSIVSVEACKDLGNMGPDGASEVLAEAGIKFNLQGTRGVRGESDRQTLGWRESQSVSM